MTKRHPPNHKKTGKRRRRWLRQFGGGLAVVAAAAVVILAVFGMTRAGGSQNSAHDHGDVTPVSEEKAAEATPRAGGPAMAFDVTSVDFGDVSLDTPVNYAFEFSNVGDATLQIEDVQVKTLEGC
jgi:hypothetical protein